MQCAVVEIDRRRKFWYSFNVRRSCDEKIKNQFLISNNLLTVKTHYSTALKYYLEAVVTASDYFIIRPTPKTLVEDFIYKRMIKCCMELQCFTQVCIELEMNYAY